LLLLLCLLRSFPLHDLALGSFAIVFVMLDAHLLCSAGLSIIEESDSWLSFNSWRGDTFVVMALGFGHIGTETTLLSRYFGIFIKHAFVVTDRNVFVLTSALIRL